MTAEPAVCHVTLALGGRDRREIRVVISESPEPLVSGPRLDFVTFSGT